MLQGKLFAVMLPEKIVSYWTKSLLGNCFTQWFYHCKKTVITFLPLDRILALWSFPIGRKYSRNDWSKFPNPNLRPVPSRPLASSFSFATGLRNYFHSPFCQTSQIWRLHFPQMGQRYGLVLNIRFHRADTDLCSFQISEIQVLLSTWKGDVLVEGFGLSDIS